MKRFMQIVPVGGFRLFDAMLEKVAELTARERGTFRRSGRKTRNRAQWSHLRYPGRITLERARGQTITARVLSRSKAADEWQLLHAFIGFLDRHFATHIQSLTVQYLD